MSLNHIYRKLLAMLFALAFCIHLCMLSMFVPFDTAHAGNLWPVGESGRGFEYMEFLETIKPEVIPTPSIRLDPIFKDFIQLNQKPPFATCKLQGKEEREFYPIPQICSHTGIFLCLRL